MRICSMIIDHLEHVNYRVEYISNRLLIFDLVIWFAADQHQEDLLCDKLVECKHPNIRIVNLNHKIKDGRDFAIMQDMSFKFIEDNYDYEICAFQSADELLTEYGIEAVERWIKAENQSFAVFAAMSNKLFCETFIAPLVFQIFRKGVKYRTNNGLSDNLRYCNGTAIDSNMYYRNLGTVEEEDKNYVIDTGYIDAYACYQKTKNWGRLCYHDEYTDKLIKLWEEGNKEGFINLFIEKSRKEYHGATDKKVVPFKYEGEYKRLIDDLGLKEEYLITSELLCAY